MKERDQHHHDRCLVDEAEQERRDELARPLEEEATQTEEEALHRSPAALRDPRVDREGAFRRAREQEEDDAISVCSSMFSETADPHKKVLRDKVHKFFKYHDKKPTSCNRAKVTELMRECVERGLRFKSAKLVDFMCRMSAEDSVTEQFRQLNLGASGH